MNPSDEHAPEAAPDAGIQRGERDGVLQVMMVVAVLVAGLIANHVLSSGPAIPQIRADGADTVQVDVVQPEVRDTEVRLHETGTVQARNAIDLSPQVSGRVEWVSAALAGGGAFDEGEVLFRLDDDDYQAGVERAQADLLARQADLRVEQAEADVARQEWQIVSPGEPVPPNVAREPQLARAQAAVRSAEAALADARLDLSRVAFTLPFKGRVLSTSIEVGQNLIAGQPYGRAYDPSAVEASVPINAAVLAGLSPAVGRLAVVRTRQQPPGNPAIAFQARVSRADAEVDPVTRLARITLAFIEPVPLLPGEFVEVEVVGPTVAQAHLFPESALRENRSVWVVKDGRLARRQPELVSIENSQLVARPFDVADGIVVTALENPIEGEPVVVAGAVSFGARP